MHFDPLLGAVLIGQAFLILIVGLVLFLRRRRREDSIAFEPEVADSSHDAVDASSAESSEAERPPVEDWTQLVPPWADELESDLSDAFERRIDEVEGGLETRIEGVEDTFLQAVEGIEDELDKGFDGVEERISAISERTDDEARRREELEAQVHSSLDARRNGASGNGADRDRGAAPSSDSGESEDEVPSRADETLAQARWNLARAFRSH